MHKIFQTKFGLKQGNCLQACVASVLDLQLNAVEDFNEAGVDWYLALASWCVRHGYGMVYIPTDTKPPMGLFGFYPILIYTVAGTSEQHAVVGIVENTNGITWAINLLHDPNSNKKHELDVLTAILIVFRGGI